MESKELKKMSRKDMLVILLEQTKRIRELEDELEKANEKLESKKVVFKKFILSVLLFKLFSAESNNRLTAI